MDSLPLEMLRSVVRFADVRDKFLLMAVSRKWETACRSLISEQRNLFVYRDRLSKPSPTALCVKCISEAQMRRMWKSLQQMKNLLQLSTSPGIEPGEGALELIKVNAAHLRVISVNWPLHSYSWRWLVRVPFPQLEVITRCATDDLRFLVQNSPFLREVDLEPSHLDDVVLHHLSLLSHLQVLTIRCNESRITKAGILLLLRGNSRASLIRVDVCVARIDDAREIEAELDLIEQTVGRRPVLDMRWEESSDSDYTVFSDSSDYECDD